MIGTEILKTDVEMAKKIEVEVGNPHLESDSEAENDFCTKSANLNSQKQSATKTAFQN